MEEHTEKLKSQSHSIQPFAIILGRIFEQKKCLVYFDCIMYRVHWILRAVDVCNTIFHLFNLKYPIKLCIVWLFI